jgi:hypothetical protein
MKAMGMWAYNTGNEAKKKTVGEGLPKREDANADAGLKDILPCEWVFSRLPERQEINER